MLPRLKRWNSLKHYTVCGAVVCFKEKALRRPGQRPFGRRRALEDGNGPSYANALGKERRLGRQRRFEGGGKSPSKAKCESYCASVLLFNSN